MIVFAKKQPCVCRVVSKRSEQVHRYELHRECSFSSLKYYTWFLVCVHLNLLLNAL